MKLHWQSTAIFGLASLILIGWLFISVPAQQSISGTVTDPNSAPIPGARISLYSLERILQTTSDTSGHFHFDAAPKGNYEVVIMSPGFKRWTNPDLYVNGPIGTAIPDKPVELTAQMELAQIGGPVVVLAATAITDEVPAALCGPPSSVTYRSRSTSDSDALAGIVIEIYPKRPVPHATVRLSDTIGALVSEQQTNERGEFQFKQVPPGHYQILFQRAGYKNVGWGEFWVARENQTFITISAEQSNKVVFCKRQ